MDNEEKIRELQDEKKEKSMISRRKLLASLGIFGVGVASTGLITQVIHNRSNETSSQGAGVQDMNPVVSTSIKGLRTNTSPRTDLIYYVMDLGQEGAFYYDSQDSSTSDNTGTVVVSASGSRFKRMMNGDRIVHASWFGVTSGDEQDQAEKIQAAVNYCYSQGGGVVRLPPGKIYVSVGRTAGVLPGIGILMRSNVYLDLTGTELHALPTARGEYGIVFFIENTDHSGVWGGRIIGERSAHTGTIGEWGMGVRIQGSSHILVRDVEIQDCWGDGIFVGNGNNNPSIKSEYVIIENVVCHNNRRQGISVTYADHVWIDRAVCTGTNGTAPEAGIDIEPDYGYQATNIYITNCTLNNNTGAGLLTYSASGGSYDPLTAPDVHNLFVSNCNANNNKGGGFQINFVRGGSISDIAASDNEEAGLMLSATSYINVSNVRLRNNKNQQSYNKGDLSLFNCAHIQLANGHVERSRSRVPVLLRGSLEVGLTNVSIWETSISSEAALSVEDKCTNVALHQVRVQDCATAALYVDRSIKGFIAEQLFLTDCASGRYSAANIQSEYFIVSNMRCTSSQENKPNYCIQTATEKGIISSSVLTGYSVAAVLAPNAGVVASNNLT